MALSRRWKQPELAYRHWYKSELDFALGQVQPVRVEPDITVYNMVAQHNVRPSADGTPPIRYGALKQCLAKVAEAAKQANASIHMPRIGAGLAGGNWEEIEKIIQDTLVAEGLTVYVYDLPGANEPGK